MSEPLYGIPAEVVDKARRVLEAACAREWSIVTAESCTGGLLASLLTDVEGASHAFERGFVVYSAKAKCELLGIAAEKIDRCGAVSEDVARAMAEGALLHSDGDLALAITGFAGAGGYESYSYQPMTGGRPSGGWSQANVLVGGNPRTYTSSVNKALGNVE